MKKIFLLFALMLMANAYAQRVTISGVVYDYDNKPMDFVTVGVKGRAIGTFTNGQGQYSLTVQTGDSVCITFSCMGYQRTERIIPKLTGNVRLNVMMREEVKEIAEVIVTGRRKQTSTVERINVDNTKLLADPNGGSIESLIVTFAGVSSTNELSSQYSVRGGNYDENIVYVNGIEINRPQLIRSGQQEGLSFINPHLTGAVGFSAGGYDATYGDKMASVLDITYKKPKPLEGAFAVGLQGANAYVGTSKGKWSQITGLRYKTNKSLVGTMDTEAEYDPSFIDLQTYVQYTPNKRIELSFLGNYSNNIYKFRPINQNTSFGTLTDVRNFTVYFDGWENDRFTTAFGAASVNLRLSDKAKVGATFSSFATDEKVSYDLSGEYWLSQQIGSDGNGNDLLGVGAYLEHARNDLRMRVNKFMLNGEVDTRKLLTRWGISIQKENIKDYTKEWILRDSAGYSVPTDGISVKVASNLYGKHTLSTTRLSAYLQETYKFRIHNGLFTLNAGIRASHWGYNKETIISPRASLAYIPNGKHDLTFRLATGIYYQAPFYKELVQTHTDANGNSYTLLNNEIRSQRSTHVVLGGDYEFKAFNRPFKLTAEAYYKHLANLNPYTVSNVKIEYAGTNSAKGYIMGFDTKLFGEFVEGTDSWVSVSFMRSRQQIGGVQLPLPTDQSYNFSLFFQDYLPGNKRFKMNLRGLFSQGLIATPSQQGYSKGYYRMPSYRRVDMGLSWQAVGGSESNGKAKGFLGAFRNVWISLDAFNLLDIKNTNSYYWISDVYGTQYAVPNYLTGRLVNLRLLVDF